LSAKVSWVRRAEEVAAMTKDGSLGEQQQGSHANGVMGDMVKQRE